MPHRDVPVTDYATLTDAGAQLIDVREPDEVAAGTLPGAVHIPLGDLPDRLEEIDRDRAVALLCRSGGRSTAAAQLLTAAGFDDVINLAGGMLAYHDAVGERS